MGIYTVELYLRVRLAVSEGMSRRQAAKHFNISRDSVAKMLSFSTPPGYQRRSPIRRPKLDAFVSTIEHWLDEDIKVPRKQRHTAKRVFDRLRDECGFTGGYTIIKDYMRKRDQRHQEVFVPLSHPPGHAQADFGEATVVIGGVEQKARFFVLDLPHSDGCYVRAYPAAVAEAWVDELVLHQLIFHAVIGERPGGVEAERVEIFVSTDNRAAGETDLRNSAFPYLRRNRTVVTSHAS